MNDNKFDNVIKDQFGNYRPDVPAHVWEKIVSQKDNKKPFAYWFNNAKVKVAAAVLCIAIASGLYFFNNKKQKSSEIIPSVAEKNINPNSNPATNSVGSTSSNTVSSKKEIGLEDIASSLSANLAKPNAGEVRKPMVENFDNPFVKRINATERTKDKSNNNTLTIKNGAAETIEMEIVRNYLSMTEILSPQSLETNRNFNPVITKKLLPKTATIPCPEAERNTAGNKRYVELFGGPDYIFTSYDDTANSAYLQQRKASTGINAAYSLGLRYTRVFKNGVSIRTGINYSHISENFISKNGFIVERVYTVNNAGDTTGTFTRSTSQFNRSKNVYRSIDVPLLMGVEFGNGRLHTNISAGASVNVFSKQSGLALDVNGNPVDISSGKSSSIYQYKTSAGVSFLGSVSFYYKLNENVHILAEPYMRYSLSPITKPDLTFKQKFHTGGVRLGVRLDF